MSLKAFHLVFITLSTLFLIGFGVWAGAHYWSDGGWVNLAYCIGAALSGVGLVIYGKYFLRKLKNISYL